MRFLLIGWLQVRPCVCFASDLCILSCVIVSLVTRVNCLLFDS